MAESDRTSERLSRIAKALGLTTEDLADPYRRPSQAQECLDLIRSFLSIPDVDGRKRVLDLAKKLSVGRP